MGFDLEVLENQIKEHMDAQPYSIKCAKCGKDLDYAKEIDRDLDLLIEVSVCDCATEAGE